MSLAVYTVVMGHPFDLHPVRPHDGVRYFCFTDQTELVTNGWEVVPLAPLFPEDPVRSSRDPKIRPHRHLSDYDASIYVDSTVLLRQDPGEIWAQLMPSEAHVFGGFYHSYRATIADEFEVVLGLGLDYPERLIAHYKHYVETNTDALTHKPVWGGFLARRHNDPACISAMETWFENVMRFSRRDQLSLTVALASLGDERVHLLSYDNYDAPTHQWPVSNVRRPPWYQVNVQPKKGNKRRAPLRKAGRKIRKFLHLQDPPQQHLHAQDPPQQHLPNVSFGFDAEAELHFAKSVLSGQRVYVSDEKRLALYSKGIAHRREWLLGNYCVPHDLIRPGDVVVDIGANVGELGLWVREAGGRYIAFEPDPAAFRALKLNMPEGALHDIALSDRNGEADFYLSTDQADSSLFRPRESTETVTVRCATLDSYLQEVGMPEAIRLLKVEAEGFEPEVLAGANAVLDRVTYIAVDAGPERGGNNTVPEVLRLLTRKGFEVRNCYLTRGTFLLTRPDVDATL